MASTTDYEQLLPEIQAIKPEEVITPNMPIDVFVQEGENLYHWCIDDRQALESSGLDANLIDQLPVRAGACREAQSLWIKERNMRQDAEQQWKEKAPAAFDLRDQLVHAFRFAFRKDESLLSRVAEIAEGDTNSDMVQDLNDLAALGRANLSLLTAIGLSADLLDQASETADQMGALLGATNGERMANNEAMIIRDKAYTYLKQAMDEIRASGKYVFWRNPDRQKGYSSTYWQRKNASKPVASAETA